MLEVLRVAAGVTTPVGLLAVLAALAYFAYFRRLKHQEAVLRALPEAQRATAVDHFLTRYKLDASNLTPAQKYDLLLGEMEKRYRLTRLLVLAGAGVFVVCFVTTAYAYLQPNPDSLHDSPGNDNKAAPIVEISTIGFEGAATEEYAASVGVILKNIGSQVAVIKRVVVEVHSCWEILGFAHGGMGGKISRSERVDFTLAVNGAPYETSKDLAHWIEPNGVDRLTFTFSTTDLSHALCFSLRFIDDGDRAVTSQKLLFATTVFKQPYTLDPGRQEALRKQVAETGVPGPDWREALRKRVAESGGPFSDLEVLVHNKQVMEEVRAIDGLRSPHLDQVAAAILGLANSVGL
jgi:hypothetical protein